MKYLNFECLLLFVCVASMFWMWHLRKLKQRFFLMMLEKIVIKAQSENENLTFFSGQILHDVALTIAKQRQGKRFDIVNSLQKGDYQPLMDILSDKATQIGLLAHFDIKKALQQVKQYIKVSPHDINAQILLGFLYVNEFDYERAKSLTEIIQDYKLNSWQKAYFLMLRAKVYFYAGNMNLACADIINAARFFKKKRQGVEEAQAYVLLGEIYRACAVSDLSYMMFTTAINLFDKMQLPAEKAKVLALLGMLLAGQQRFKESAEKLSLSRKIFHKIKFYKAEAEVINQQALNFLLTNRVALSLRYAEKALQMHLDCENQRGVAQSYDLMAMGAARKKQFQRAQDWSQIAADYYLQTGNYAAYLESLFLKASMLFSSAKIEQAENLCHELLKLCECYTTCFHVANVYALLGNICLRRKDFHKAKYWLQQSLAREQSDDRYAGAALDYFNLALVERNLCNLDEVQANLHNALEAAIKSTDDNLCTVIRKHIAKIT